MVTNEKQKHHEIASINPYSLANRTPSTTIGWMPLKGFTKDKSLVTPRT